MTLIYLSGELLTIAQPGLIITGKTNNAASYYNHKLIQGAISDTLQKLGFVLEEWTYIPGNQNTGTLIIQGHALTIKAEASSYITEKAISKLKALLPETINS